MSWSATRYPPHREGFPFPYHKKAHVVKLSFVFCPENTFAEDVFQRLRDTHDIVADDVIVDRDLGRSIHLYFEDKSKARNARVCISGLGSITFGIATDLDTATLDEGIFGQGQLLPNEPLSSESESDSDSGSDTSVLPPRG